MINLRKNYRQLLVGSSVLMALAVPGASTAALLNNTLDFPLIRYNSQNVTTNYILDDQAFTVNSFPVLFQTSPGADSTIIPDSNGVENFIIDIRVDSTGALIGGNPGHDLVVYGEVTLPGSVTVTGVLLTGEVTAFGFQDSGFNDNFDFTFSVTGGLLEDYYPSGTVAVNHLVESSTFTGDFTDFEGESKGTLGSIPLQTASLGDRVWQDLNSDGIQNCMDGGANDPNFPADGIIGNAGDAGTECNSGIPNVTVNLLNPGTDGVCGTDNEMFIKSQTTNSEGFYLFPAIDPGAYCVEVVKPTGFECTANNMGGDNAADSDVIDQGDGTCQTVDPSQDPINLVAGDYDRTWDAGLVPQTAALGDRVWLDVNSDGIQNCTDGGANDFNFPADGILGNAGDAGTECNSGIANVTVQLLNPGNDGFCGTDNETVIESQTTNSDGFYLFDDINPATYCVAIVKPAGFECTANNMGGDDAADSDVIDQGDGTCQTVDPNQNPINLVAGDNDLTWDAGLVRPTASLGDRVWEDVNSDGIQNCTDGGANDANFPADGVLGNAGDSGAECNSGIADVLVNLLNPGTDGSCGTGNETVIESQTTNSDGFYLFDDIDPGVYCVAVIKPIGFECTVDNMGTNDVADSDVVDQGDGSCQTVDNNQNPIDVSAGENDLTWDAGLVRSNAALGDRVWQDLNGNGVQDCTDTNGNGVVGDNGDFGAECGAGVAGVSVALLENPDGDATCTSGDEFANGDTDVTDSNGFYLFPDLVAGNYCVAFTLPNGYVYTAQNQGGDAALDSDADTVTGRTENVDLPTNVTNVSVDAGIIQPASLGDVVWNDVDRDGLLVNEPTVAGIQVELFNCRSNPVTDINGNPVLATVTDNNGIYNFGNLKPGGYTVKFTISSGLEFTTAVRGPDELDSDAETFSQDGTMGTTRCITLVSGEYNPNVDAGIRSINESRIGDFVWNDTNANGIQDTDELGNGIDGVPVELLRCGVNDQLISTGIVTNTNASGLYFFEGLAAGRYAVEFDLAYLDQQGFIVSPRFAGFDTSADSDADPSTGASACIDLGVRDQNLSLDAGVYQPASLGDRVWLDGNGDGVQNNNEGGVPGAQVDLFDCSNNAVVDIFGNPVTSVFTDAAGLYNFVNLLPGNYTVKFTSTSGLGFTIANAVGSDETEDSDAEVFAGNMGTTSCITLGSGEENLDVDAGLVLPPPQCSLDVNATCAIIPMLQPVNFVCSDAKPLDTLSMVWNGQNDVSIIAYYGKTDDTVLTTRNDINNGDVVTISGFAGAGNDIEWEIFDVNGDSLGVSRFHMSCSDSGMNGPEDCGAPQGNSKDDSSSFNNNWLLEGLVGTNGVALVCNPPTNPPVTAESCSYLMPTDASCDSKVTSLSLRYLAGDCIISNPQEGKANCLVDGTAGDTVRIKVSNGGSDVFLDTVDANVTVGDVVTATAQNAGNSEFGSNTVIEIFSATGNLVQQIEMHTSCSKILSLGDQFGALDVVAMDTKDGEPISAGVDVLYNYTIVNNSNERFIDDASDSFGLLGTLSLDALGGSAEFSRTQFVLPGVNNVFNNTLTVSGNLMPSGVVCSAQDSVTVTVEVPPTPQPLLTCDDIKPLTELSMVWKGANGTTATTAAGQVFENLQDGDLINFIVDKNTYGNDFVVTLDGGVNGSSEFHLSCSDEFMDGSDDCGTAQGNNKGDDSNLEDSWLLNGMTGETGSFSCDLPNNGVVDPIPGVLPPVPMPVLTCSDIKPLTELSMVWDGASGTTVTTAAGQVFANLQQGNLINFIVDRNLYGNDFAVTLSGAVNGSSEFHLSCSDEFMNGSDDCGVAQGNNKGDDADLENTWSLNGMSGVSGSFSCALPITGVVAGTISAAPVGTVRTEFKEFKDKEFKFFIHNDGNTDVFIERITLDWPTSVNGKLVEIKNDGNNIYDTDTAGPSVVISTWRDKQDKRKVKADDKSEVKFKFDNDINTNMTQYSVEIELSTGEIITLM